MNVLVVGAGALGQVFGLRLASGGDTVSYLTKPEHAARASSGLRLYRVRRFREPVSERLVPERVFTDTAEIGLISWDAVWLCVPSPALRGGWVANLRDAIGDATVVSVGQDVRDRGTLGLYWPDAQVVRVLPSLLAYPAPLADEALPEPGIAYWIPSGTFLALSGADERVRPLVTALNRGGVRAKAVGTAGEGDIQATLIVPYVAALEASGWSLRALRKRLRFAAAAAREASAAVATVQGVRPPSRLVTSPHSARVALALLPRIVPFDLERYLRVHFTKVGAQTREMLDGWIAEASSHGLPRVRMEELRGSLPPSGTKGG